MDVLSLSSGLKVDLPIIVIIFTVFTLLHHLIFGIIYSKLADGFGMGDKMSWAWLPIMNLVLFYKIVQTDRKSRNTKAFLVLTSLFLAVLPGVPFIYLLSGEVQMGVIVGAVNMIILQVFFYGYGMMRFNEIFARRIGNLSAYK
ncbi:MAG: hypothetical protein ABS949_03700 [Solibacillus sp.]